ncbi:MAG: 23S rRNA (uracil(1939)-C(5))-methyltransferase RlmD [Balneolaceae bacterium]|nr:MAG: 23S rRNA (uracil(1939)-C(5))-methyltransferase RlmD [Balneolaceae bacterium]
MAVKKGQVVEVEIESTAFKGKGVAKLEGQALFVSGVAPGDVVEARIIKKKKKYLEAKLLQIKEPSPLRIEPKCSHANVCGGCTWQHLSYQDQLIIKQQHVRDHIERIAGLNPDLVAPIAGCDHAFYYRNKMEYSFGTKRWLTEEEIRSDQYVDDTAFSAGLHAPGRFDKILNLRECHLQPEISFQLLDFVRNYCIKNDIPAFDTFKKEGFMRHLVIRNSHYTDDLMVNLVTFKDDPDIINQLADQLLAEFPSITTIVNNVNDQPNPTAVGRYEKIIYGSGYIVDHIGDHSFKIHANAFFQTNTKQAEKLYSIAREFAKLDEEKLLFDLYCGVGTLSLFMADKARKVLGIELVGVAVENARFNAKENSVDNAEFVLGDMKDTFNDDFLSKHGQPDCIITDPPRSGMHPDVVTMFTKLNVPTIVYVSCNPSTMARDLNILKEFYDVERIQPVDMFPQTYHIEAVAKLTRR